MQRDEIIRYLKVGSSKEVVVARDICEEYIGHVRTITIVEETLLRIEFNVYGYDEGGISYSIRYKNMEQLIYSLEKYLGKKLEEWENINRTGYYPESISDEIDDEQIKQDLKKDAIRLPELGDEMWIADGYWKDLHENM